MFVYLNDKNPPHVTVAYHIVLPLYIPKTAALPLLKLPTFSFPTQPWQDLKPDQQEVLFSLRLIPDELHRHSLIYGGFAFEACQQYLW